MKFSLKVFIVTIIVVSLSFTAGGYYLITSLFNSSLQMEITSAEEESKMFRFTYETALSGLSNINRENITLLTEQILSNISGRETIVRISGLDHTLLYTSGATGIDSGITTALEEGARAWTIQSTDEGYYIQTACYIFSDDNGLYLETIRNISNIFIERDSGFKTLQQVLFILIITNALLLFFITRVLTNPIRRLSRAARRIALGDISHRAKVESGDEIGALAADFNKMADEIEYRIHELQEANRRQEDFVASFAHELKTPLTSMIGYADMIRSREMAAEDRFLAAGYIFSEGKRLEVLSLKLLELIVLKKRDFELKKVSVVKLFSDVAGLMKPALEGNIALNISADDETLLIEPDLFKTLMINLLDNARKSIDGKGTIYLTGRKEKNGYTVYVKDTGGGIPPEDISKLTEAFYMVDKSRARNKGGAGLGLAICAEIVSLHGGEIGFDSIVGQGTIVKVTLIDKQ